MCVCVEGVNYKFRQPGLVFGICLLYDEQEIKYDKAVLATGSYPFVPPTPGVDKKGVFVYRTIDDLEVSQPLTRCLHFHPMS